MQVTSRDIARLVGESMTENVTRNEQLRAMNNGLTDKQKNLIVEKIAEQVAGICNAQKLITTLSIKEAEPFIKNIIDLTVPSSLAAINQQLISLSNTAVKNNRPIETWVVFNDWIKNANQRHEKTIEQCVEVPVDEVYPPLHQFSRSYLRASIEKSYAELKSNETFPNLQDAIDDLNDEPAIRKFVLDKITQSVHKLVEPHLDSLSTEQAQRLIERAKEMFLCYTLQDIGHENMLHFEPEVRDKKINDSLINNTEHMQKFLKAYVSVIQSTDNTVETATTNSKDATEKLTTMIDSFSNLTSLAGDVVSNAPDIHHTIPTDAMQRLNDISHIGSTTYAVGTGISAFSLPINYTIAKLRNQKPPEITAQQGVQSAVKGVGFSLAVAAICVPHVAATLTAVSAVLGTIVAAANTANFFYEKSQLPGEIKNAQERINQTNDSLKLIAKQLTDLHSISEQINDGAIFSRPQMDKYLEQLERIEGLLLHHMGKLQTETKNLSQLINKLNKEFSLMETLGSSTNAVTSAVYGAGAIMQLVPILNVAGNALMATSDVCNIGYAASAKLVELNSSLKNPSTLFNHPAKQEAPAQANRTALSPSDERPRRP